MADKDLQVREKQELQTEAEHTRPGLVFTPTVDIFESEQEITVLADMPGVASDGVTIDPRGLRQKDTCSESTILEGSTDISPFLTVSIRAESALL